MITAAVASPGGSAYCRGSARRWVCLPPRRLPPFNGLFRQPAGVPLLRHSVAAAHSSGILTASSIGLALRLILRHRLTPGRLTSPGKPWSYGEGASHPLYRYLYLHLLFRTLQHGSRHTFDADRNAPLPILLNSMSSVDNLYPIIIHA